MLFQAAHPDTDSAFEIQPSSLNVNVGQGDAAVAEEFVVTGFSVSGRVVDVSGNGVPTVSIYVNGKERATTDLNGRWALIDGLCNLRCPVGFLRMHLLSLSRFYLLFRVCVLSVLIRQLQLMLVNQGVSCTCMLGQLRATVWGSGVMRSTRGLGCCLIPVVHCGC